MYVRPHGTTRLQLDGFYLHLIPEHFFFLENLSRKFKFHSIVTETPALYIKIDVHLCWYLAEFFLEWELFQTKVVQKVKTHILCSTTVFRTLCRLWECEKKKCGTAGQATNGNIILRMHFVCWITKATDSHSEYVILSVFYGKDGYANAPQCYFSKNTACGHLLAALPSQGKKCHAIKKKYYNINRHYQGNEGLSRNSLLPRGGRSISA